MKYFLLFLLPFVSQAQFGFEFSPTLPVSKNGIQLHNAWAGGLNYVQISDFDFDFDGDEDLFIFDRSNNNIRVFENRIVNGTRSYHYIHEAHRFFPEGIYSRATFVDYDGDGRKDIFCYGLGGLMVYKNIGDAANGLRWQLEQDIVYSNYNGNIYNLAVTSTDIPAIIDVDGDGDIDVLTFHMGGAHLEYHKNMSMEMYGIPDSFKFVLKNECWGGFEESNFNNSILLNSQNYPCVGSTITNPEYPTNQQPNFQSIDLNDKSLLKHAGSTVLALDYTGNGVLDLIMGDISFPNLVYLENLGQSVNNNSLMGNTDMQFPSNTLPAHLPVFPAPFYVDVNFDGKKDLLVGTAARNISKNEQSLWYYENIGTTQNPHFEFRQKDFLQSSMIDHGRGSVPVLFDINGDGLKDLLVANFYLVKDDESYESKIALYTNVGDATSPSFEFTTDDWLQLSTKQMGIRLIPTFGDINNDGFPDLIIGKSDGTLVLFEGNGTSFTEIHSEVVDENNVPLRGGNFAFPQLFDLNNDGLLDIVMGNGEGKLIYFKNVGTSENPKFRFITNNLGNINRNTSSRYGFSAPHFFRQNGITHLFCGNDQGRLDYYTDVQSNLESGSSFSNTNSNYLNINTEGHSSFFVDDINNNSNLNLFIGLDMGGLWHYEANPNNDLSTEVINSLKHGLIKMFPNPTTGIVNFQYHNIQILEYSVLDQLGKIITELDQTNANSINLSTLPPGAYLFRFLTTSGTIFHRVIKQ